MFIGGPIVRFSPVKMPPESTITSVKLPPVCKVVGGACRTFCAKADDEKAAIMIIERFASLKDDFNGSLAKFPVSSGRILDPPRKDMGKPATRESRVLIRFDILDLLGIETIDAISRGLPLQ